MGLCSSCFKNPASAPNTPDMETRRRQQVEAAEKRLHENESRGIKDLDKVKRLQKRAADSDRIEEIAARQYGTNDGPGLKWQVS